MSPSMRREWIEIFPVVSDIPLRLSPSMRREWIEISGKRQVQFPERCLPPCGGSGLKCQRHEHSHIKDCGLPPCGGSGLKSVFILGHSGTGSLPPCGGSGLKYVFSSLKTTKAGGLPPCGGSGLKWCPNHSDQSNAAVSLHAEGVD